MFAFLRDYYYIGMTARRAVHREGINSMCSIVLSQLIPLIRAENGPGPTRSGRSFRRWTSSGASSMMRSYIGWRGNDWLRWSADVAS